MDFCTFENFPTWMTSITSKIRWYFAKFLRIERHKWWKNFHSILKKTLQLACSVAVSIDICLRLSFLDQPNPNLLMFSKKTLIGGISCVNTRLAFGTSILLPKDQNGNRRKKLKLIYKIKNKNNNNYEDKKLVGKILKMDESKQYSNAMT